MARLPPLHSVVLMSYGWFGTLPKQTRNDVMARTHQRRLSSGERLYSRGDKPSGIFSVVEGSIRVRGILDGRETVLDFYGPGTWFGEIAFLDGLPRAHDAEAHGNAVVNELDAKDVEELFATHAEFGRGLLRLAGLRIRILLMAIEQYSVHTLEQRLASRLLVLSGPYGNRTADGLQIDLHLPQETLAQLIGSTRQRINQILGAWERASIVNQKYGRICLLDKRKLEAIAEGHPRNSTAVPRQDLPDRLS